MTRFKTVALVSLVGAGLALAPLSSAFADDRSHNGHWDRGGHWGGHGQAGYAAHGGYGGHGGYYGGHAGYGGYGHGYYGGHGGYYGYGFGPVFGGAAVVGAAARSLPTPFAFSRMEAPYYGPASGLSRHRLA